VEALVGAPGTGATTPAAPRPRGPAIPSF